MRFYESVKEREMRLLRQALKDAKKQGRYVSLNILHVSSIFHDEEDEIRALETATE